MAVVFAGMDEIFQASHRRFQEAGANLRAPREYGEATGLPQSFSCVLLATS